MTEDKTTIQIGIDVKARLEEERCNDKESMNDILRRVLEMNEVVNPEAIPHFYQGVIKIPRLNFPGMEQIWNPILVDPDYDGTLHNTIIINGVGVDVDVSQMLTMTVEADTEEEVLIKIKAIINLDKIPQVYRNYIECHTTGVMQVDYKTGKRLEKGTDRLIKLH